MFAAHGETVEVELTSVTVCLQTCLSSSHKMVDGVWCVCGGGGGGGGGGGNLTCPLH